ncbi:unnamed protein product [Paramecium sonneborni]|uniref:Uncharacterized protein n=1 Tax=Paramecium sonneborni TaxID=65129 RepID=A0A8S1K227_9CILI|nr:unnamed protein product [Paramecium sonneborni]
MGSICSSKKEQSPQRITQSTQSTPNQIFLLIETKIQKFYRPHQKLSNISNSTILKRRRTNMELNKDFKLLEAK